MCTTHCVCASAVLLLASWFGESRLEPLPEPTVSAAELIHQVPDRAKKQLRNADKACYKGNLKICLEHVRAAISIDPAFLQARRIAAKLFTQLGQLDEAIAEYRELLAIDPHSSATYVGLGAVYGLSGKYEEAEACARRSIALNGSDPRARLLLGESLAHQNKDAPEALKLLLESCENFPEAHYTAAHVLVRQGELQKAATELEAYLPFSPVSERNQIQSLIHRLTAGNR